MLIALICWVLRAYYLILIVRIILSWVPSLPEPLQPIAAFIRSLTDPLLAPLRGLLPPLQVGMAAIDLSPLVLFFGIILLQNLLCR